MVHLTIDFLLLTLGTGRDTREHDHPVVILFVDDDVCDAVCDDVCDDDDDDPKNNPSIFEL